MCSNRKLATVLSSSNELIDENSSVIGILFREKVAAFHRLPVRVRSPLPPNAERTAVFCIERVERTVLSPQMQHRTFDSLAGFLVRTIVFDVDRRRSSIFFTNAVNAGRIAVVRNVFVENLCAERSVPEWIFEGGRGRAQ